MTLTMKYISKLENSIALFTDGVNVIQLYGHDKVNNGFNLGSVYDVTFVPGLYYYKSEFTYISHSSSQAYIDDVSPAKAMTATDLYSYTYVLEPKYASDIAKNLAYAELFINAYSFTGYVNYYIKDNQYNISFDDSPKNAYQTYQNARDAKSMFINNSSSIKLYYDKDFSNCIFWEEASIVKEEKYQIEMTFVPYLLNTNKYFQIQVFEDSYQVNVPS